MKLKHIFVAAMLSFAIAAPASAFCGFYVAQADGDLFNGASKVAVARKGDRTVVTMSNDYSGELSEFAIVIPVPTVITRAQVHVTTPGPMKALDSFSAPRLAEYYDPNPCEPEYIYEENEGMIAFDEIVVTGTRIEKAKSYGVTIEDSYTAGEYDILILSAKDSGGLQDWLKDSGYKLPDGATRILRSYIRSGMKFFVAKVNLAEKAKKEGDWLSPISIAYEDRNFMLPIRLGTLNADGSQDLIVFALSSEGRVETTNYKTRKIPTDKEVPLFLKEQEGSFGEFYKAMFNRSVQKAGGAGVFMEYFWDLGSCDPCAGEPPSIADLLELGVFWMDDYGGDEKLETFESVWNESGNDLETFNYGLEELKEESYWGDDLFITRLHVRYDARRFPEDLEFIETGDSDEYFQGRYVINVPWRGEAQCDAVPEYEAQVKARQQNEIATLASLTGWPRAAVRMRVMANGDLPFSIIPKPEAVQTPDKDETEAREIYNHLLWWGGAFPDLVETPELEDNETEN